MEREREISVSERVIVKVLFSKLSRVLKNGKVVDDTMISVREPFQFYFISLTPF